MKREGAAPVATYAVLGDPVAHSLSPRIQNAAFRGAGLSAHYVARRVSAEECGPVLRDIALTGGGGNVTVPHKQRVLPFLDRCSAAVTATGACNTFWAQGGKVWGDNTDVEGFQGTWDSAVVGPRQKPVALVLGAGGAARAVLFALLDSGGASRILLWNRTPERAWALASYFADDRVSTIADCTGRVPGVVVNATSAGLRGRGTPIDLTTLGQAPHRVIDLVYGSGPTPLCRQAHSLGVPAVDGREMLLRQAEAAYFRWFGAPPPRGVMTRALR